MWIQILFLILERLEVCDYTTLDFVFLRKTVPDRGLFVSRSDCAEMTLSLIIRFSETNYSFV